MRPAGDRLTRALLAVIALALVWLALRPEPAPAVATGPGGAVSVSLERLGGRTLVDGVLPVRCLR